MAHPVGPEYDKMKVRCNLPYVCGMCFASLPVPIPVRGGAHCRSSSGEHAETSGRHQYSYNAGASSERRKATIEHVFGGESNEHNKGSSAAPPWHMGWQMNERNLVWSNDLKLRLLQRNVAQELGLSDEEAQQRIVDVTALLPGLATRLAAIRAATVVRFCADIKVRRWHPLFCKGFARASSCKPCIIVHLPPVQALADRLIHLKAIFPGADAGQILLQQPAYMLTQDLGAIQQSAERLHQLIPGVNIDRYCPRLLC